MFYDALGLTVLCLPAILVLAVGVPFVIMAIQRYQQAQATKREKNKKKPTATPAKPNRAVSFVRGLVTLSRLFLLTFATLTALAYGVWLLFLAVT
ncbi:MAG: hypothetical protein ACOYLB_00730 [Phototrophicaceae bacterium]